MCVTPMGLFPPHEVQQLARIFALRTPVPLGFNWPGVVVTYRSLFQPAACLPDGLSVHWKWWGAPPDAS